MLLSVLSKVLTRIILERLSDAFDKKLRQEQAGFRKDRSCTDHITKLRINIEQSLEQSPLYMTFVDFENAFDSKLYEDSTSQVIHKGKLTKPLPMIFLMVIDWIMLKTTHNVTGIQWSFTKRLEDLDFSGDMCLLSHKHQHTLAKLNRLSEEASKMGLQLTAPDVEFHGPVTPEQNWDFQLKCQGSAALWPGHLEGYEDKY
ncbi:uncharacterized protein LOC131948157 [Physella acuta]|uniref:uncharacterized protein LOC131948157 n=1 Tax=Physella acuta TaxID=109671 RepID=UPI0027DB118A|nr:uncharacterized protein LOC131948157 [Physella acuta]